MLLEAMLWNAVLATALAAAVALVGRTKFFRRRPAVMHLLWFAVLVKLVVPPLVPVPCLPGPTDNARTEIISQRSPVGYVALENRRDAIGTAAEPAELAPSAVSDWRPDLSWALLSVSLAGTLFLVARFVRLSLRAGRQLRTAYAAPERLTSLAAGLANRLQVSPVPDVQIVEASITPVLWMRPRKGSIVFPRGLADELDDEQISCILSHELAHLLRHDRAFNLVGLAVVALFWWHPVAWWALWQMQARQEECCDALAIARLSRSRRLYAETLLRALDFSQATLDLGMLASPGFGNRSHIAGRFEMIANSSVRPNCSLFAFVLAALGAASFTCFPVRADNQSADAAKESKQALPKSLDTPEAVTQMNESVRNLKQLCIALHDWAGAHQLSSGTSSTSPNSSSSSSSQTPFRFPPAVVYGKDGKGKYPHSWRVELLPFLGARNLYNRYHFDEPWDSPANKVVLANMPEVFRDPADAAGSVNSGYFVLVGRLVDETVDGPALQTFFSSKVGVAFRQVTDGATNTIAIVEAKRDIPWTKPEDIPYDPNGTLPQLGGFFRGGFCATFGDSSTWFLEEPIKDSALKAMISPAAGDKVDYVRRPQRIPFGREPAK
jgi:beta-lactamase regulating signal transducer with metallopeptidase domain